MTVATSKMLPLSFTANNKTASTISLSSMKPGQALYRFELPDGHFAAEQGFEP